MIVRRTLAASGRLVVFTFEISRHADNKFSLLAGGLKAPAAQLFFQLRNSVGIELLHVHSHGC